MFFLNSEDVATLGASEGQWAEVTTTTGRMKAVSMDVPLCRRALIRVPPAGGSQESQQGLEIMSGMWDFSDAQLTPDDDPDLIDREQGIPQMKGLACRIEMLGAEDVSRLEEIFGPTDDLPRGPKARCLDRSPARRLHA